MTASASSGYEKKDVNVAKIVGFTIAIIVFLAAVLIFLNEYFVYSKENLIYEEALKPGSKDLRELHAREDEELNSYKVLDARKGVYQIPIDRAMQVLADEYFQKKKSDSSK